MSLTTKIVTGTVAAVALVATPGVVATGLKATHGTGSTTTAASGSTNASGAWTRHRDGYGPGGSSYGGGADQAPSSGQADGSSQGGYGPGRGAWGGSQGSGQQGYGQQGYGRQGSGDQDPGSSGSGSQGSGSGSSGPQGSGSDTGTSGLRRAADGSVLSGTKVSGVTGVVMVDTVLPGGRGEGTGMVLTSDGEVLTNYHVVEGSTSVTVKDSTTGRSYVASVVGHDATHDVAVLRLKGATNLHTVTLSQRAARLGDQVAAIGQGGGQGSLYRVSGTISAVDQSISAGDESGSAAEAEQLTGLVQTTADLVPGYSGGPLVDSSGAVVGLDTAASSGEDVDGYAVPIAQAKAIADQIVAGTRTATIHIGPRGALGVSVASADRTTGATGGWGSTYGSAGRRGSGQGSTGPDTSSGAVVQQVLSGSAAARVGITAGSTVTAVDGTAVTSASALSKAVSEDYPGTRVTVAWTDPSGTTHRTPVTLGTSTVA